MNNCVFWCQFPQFVNFSYERRFFMYTYVHEIVDEIDAWGQFHQHIYAQLLCP